MKEFTVIIEKGEDGYLIASVPDLSGCHTQGKTLDELIENVKEAIQLCLDVEREEVSLPTSKFVAVHRVTV